MPSCLSLLPSPKKPYLLRNQPQWTRMLPRYPGSTLAPPPAARALSRPPEIVPAHGVEHRGPTARAEAEHGDLTGESVGLHCKNCVRRAALRSQLLRAPSDAARSPDSPDRVRGWIHGTGSECSSRFDQLARVREDFEHRAGTSRHQAYEMSRWARQHLAAGQAGRKPLHSRAHQPTRSGPRTSGSPIIRSRGSGPNAPENYQANNNGTDTHAILSST